MMNTTPSPRCTDCGVMLEPIEAESVTADGKPRCDSCYWTLRLATPVLPAHKRFLHSVTCAACKHEFLADSKSLAPEGCPECGHLDIARPPQYRTARLLKAAHSHLTSAGATLSTLRRERAAGK